MGLGLRKTQITFCRRKRYSPSHVYLIPSPPFTLKRTTYWKPLLTTHTFFTSRSYPHPFNSASPSLKDISLYLQWRSQVLFILIMTGVIQSAPTSSLSSASSQTSPLVTAAKNPLSMPIVSSRFARVIPQYSAPPKATTHSLPFTPSHPLSMRMGTSFAAVIPNPSAPATPNTPTPKPSWNRELDHSGNTKISPPEKKGRGRHNKPRTPRGQGMIANPFH